MGASRNGIGAAYAEGGAGIFRAWDPVRRYYYIAERGNATMSKRKTQRYYMILNRKTGGKAKVFELMAEWIPFFKMRFPKKTFHRRLIPKR
jgi:hypothetical protein